MSPKDQAELAFAIGLVVMTVVILLLVVFTLEYQVKLGRLMKENIMALKELKDAIEHATTVQTAAAALIRKIADELANLRPGDEGEIRRLAAELRQRADELAAAIAEHEEDDGDTGEPGEGETRRR